MKIINDGSVIGGSRDLTLSNGHTYNTDDFSFDGTSTVMERTDGNNVPTGRKITEGATIGTATLQFDSTSTPFPTMGLQFTETEGTFYISQPPGRAETKAGETKIRIAFMKALTTDIVVSDA